MASISENDKPSLPRPAAARELPTVAHVHAAFLPPTEHWICRLTAGVCGFRHIALSARRTAGHLPACDHVRHLSHGLEAPAAERHSPSRSRRYRAAFRIAYAGGLPAAALRKLAAEEIQPDVVHVHFGDVAWRWRRLISRLDAAVVVSFYGYDYATLPRLDQRWRDRLAWVFAKADLLIAEGPHAAGRLVDLGADEAKVRVVNLGTGIPPAPALPPPLGRHFLQVATLKEKKGQLDTLAAFNRLAADHPDARLTLVGGDNGSAYAKTVRDAADASAYAARIRWRPFVPAAELPTLFAEADYFVQPSVTAADGDSEGGAPVALLDAQAYGLPVIVSDHCDLPFVSADLGWNRPVPAGDVEALNRAMAVGLGRTKAQRLRDREQTRAFAAASLDVRRWSAVLEEAYRSLI